MTEVHQVLVEPLGREIACQADQTILDACLRSAIWIPHGCSHGTCGTCKAELVSGDVDYGDTSTATLMATEREAGKLLLCSATPKSNVVIRAPVAFNPSIELYPVRDFVGTVVSIEELAHETRRLLLELDEPMDFVAGQYVNIQVPGGHLTRAYSMANPPSERVRLELHVRRTPGGAATDGWIFMSLQKGAQVNLSGPFGSFLLRTDRPEPAIMIAGGTGLAPLKSMIRQVLEGGLEQRLHLYQGARTRADLYDVEFFDELARNHAEQFIYRPCLSEETWGGASGLVTDVLSGDFERCRGFTAYVCGPPAMVEAATKTLIAKRLQSRDIYRENFFDQSDKGSDGRRGST